MARMKKLVFTTICLGTVAAALGLIQAQAQNDTPKTIDSNCWATSFNDEFDTLDYWNPETGEGQWKTSYIWDRDTIINDELQYYIDPKEHGISPFKVNNGILNIVADKTPGFHKNTVDSRCSPKYQKVKDYGQRFGCCPVSINGRQALLYCLKLM